MRQPSENTNAFAIFGFVHRSGMALQDEIYMPKHGTSAIYTSSNVTLITHKLNTDNGQAFNGIDFMHAFVTYRLSHIC